MSRVLFLLSSLSMLACGGAVWPAHETRSFQAFSIQTLSGTVGAQEDLGLEGSIDVAATPTTQAVTWTATGTPVADATLAGLWTLTHEMATLQGIAVPPDMPPIRPVPAGDKEGRGWSYAVAMAWYEATAVACPSSGVDVVVFTSGLKYSAQPLHAESIASIHCADHPPAARARAVADSFVFSGGPEWRETDRAPGTGSWVDGRTVLVVRTSHLDETDPDLRAAACRAYLSAARNAFGTYVLEPESIVTVDTTDGCRQDVRVHPSDGEEKAWVRTVIRRCEGGSALTAMCFAWEQDATLDVCEGVYACAPPHGPVRQ